MDNNYLDQKIKEILSFTNMDINPNNPNLNSQKRFLRLILETIWLAGKIEGVQSVKELLK